MPDRQLSLANSEAAFARARKVMPGAVNSPLRAFKCMDTSPLFVKEGEGPFIEDVDGNRYIDLSMCHGGLIHGHANEQIVAALSKAIGRGTGFGFATENETQLASRIIEAYSPKDGSASPIELVRLTSSSTEAAMCAIRLARAATGREKIVKVAGGYHGHVDCLLCEAGGSVLALGNSSTLGVPPTHLTNTLIARFNDLESLENLFVKNPGQ
ncbi:MAG TPA: aminotransferase class III-fold pyridoxal phosphate-dependent enzyme, partial [Tepidisphaeraceae bacterium]|nr:aminotransferase class III-fold pyridoxal phosphate-dependent enzyme [Tepidisphaeraceae bacterium]